MTAALLKKLGQLRKFDFYFNLCMQLRQILNFFILDQISCKSQILAARPEIIKLKLKQLQTLLFAKIYYIIYIESEREIGKNPKNLSKINFEISQEI